MTIAITAMVGLFIVTAVAAGCNLWVRSPAKVALEADICNGHGPQQQGFYYAWDEEHQAEQTSGEQTSGLKQTSGSSGLRPQTNLRFNVGTWVAPAESTPPSPCSTIKNHQFNHHQFNHYQFNHHGRLSSTIMGDSVELLWLNWWLNTDVYHY